MIIIRVNSSDNILIAKIDRPNCFNRFHSETMLLLAALCGMYCKEFITCASGACNLLINKSTDLLINVYYRMGTDVYCTKAETVDVLSKPGHWCSGTSVQERTCYNLGTTYAMGYDRKYCYWCLNHKYIPPASPEPTIPKIKDPKYSSNNCLPLVSFFVLTTLA